MTESGLHEPRSAQTDRDSEPAPTSDRLGLGGVLRRLRSWRDGAQLPVQLYPFRINTLRGKRPVATLADDQNEVVLQLDVPGATRKNTEVALDAKGELWITVSQEGEDGDPLWQYRFMSAVGITPEQISVRLGSGVLTLRINENVGSHLGIPSLVPPASARLSEPALGR